MFSSPFHISRRALLAAGCLVACSVAPTFAETAQAPRIASREDGVSIAQPPLPTLHVGAPRAQEGLLRVSIPCAPGALLEGQGIEATIGDTTTCPVSGETFVVTAESPHVEHDGLTYYFCCAGCDARFAADPHQYLSGHES